MSAPFTVPNAPIRMVSAEACADAVVEAVGPKIVLGLPLGLGKPNQFVNALYRKAQNNPAIQLKIVTALSLEKPVGKSDLEKRFLEPFVDRVFGNYEPLQYMTDLRANQLPENVEICEFFFKSGSMLHQDYAQQHYISTNYTHVFRDLMDHGVNVLAQLVASRGVEQEETISLSSNTDVTLDLVPLIEERRQQGEKIIVVGQIHQDLPYMINRAEVSPSKFDFLLSNATYNTELFGVPNMAVGHQDFAIGMHASSLVKDGGTLQIGIGSLGDAVSYACELRQTHNEVYRRVLDELTEDRHQKDWVNAIGGVETFDKGLYGCSEMFVNGFLHLIEKGVIKREVFENRQLQKLLNEDRLSTEIKASDLGLLVEEGVIENPITIKDYQFLKHFGYLNEEVSWENHQLQLEDEPYGKDLLNLSDKALGKLLGDKLKSGIFMHGGFFLGPTSFYESLRTMNYETAKRIEMTSVGHVNQLYGDVPLEVEQRKHARFINTGLMATLSGAVVSDALETGEVVSGVGGQYNFVAMAHSLPGARSILAVRSVRESKGQVMSNIVYNYGHITIPRHLRDIIITEYGIADIRGKTDAEVYKNILNICDSRFQEGLLIEAKKHGKIEKDYEIPETYRHNFPERLDAVLEPYQKQGYFDPFPMGCDFTSIELTVGKCLKRMKAKMEGKSHLIELIKPLAHIAHPSSQVLPYLRRMGLENPHGFLESVYQKLLIHELEELGIE